MCDLLDTVMNAGPRNKQLSCDVYFPGLNELSAYEWFALALESNWSQELV